MKKTVCLLLAIVLLSACTALPEDVPANATDTTSTNTTGTTTATASTVPSSGLPSNTASGTTTTSTTTAPPPGTTTTSTTTTTEITTTTSTQPVVQVEEIQAVWVASIINLDFPSAPGLSAEQLKSECEAIFTNIKAMGLNTVYFQVRPSGDALYPSAIFPSSAYVVQNQGDELPLDLLDYMLTAAHREGLKLYAWINPVRVRHTAEDVLHGSNPAILYPDRAVACSDGKTYYNLGLPEVRTMIADGVAEIVENYPVDGVIFDDYFYPYGDVAFDDADAFALYGAGQSLAEFRRASVNRLIKACYNRVKAIRANCVFGVAPFGIRKNSDAGTEGMESYYKIYCDPIPWIQGSYVDFIEPQLYWSLDDEDAPFGALANYWSKAVDGTGVQLRVALAPYKYVEGNYTADEITRQVTYLRRLPSYGGSSLFRYAFLQPPDEYERLFK